MFVYLTTCGGFFFGWFRDLWRLPTYCGQADETTEPLNAELTIHQIRAQTSPQGPHWFQLTRFLASACVGSLYGYIMSSVFDLSFLGTTSAALGYQLLGSFGVAIAVWLIGNMGMHTGPFKQAMYGALMGLVVGYIAESGKSSSGYGWCILLSFLRFGQHRTWTSIEAHFARRGNGGEGGEGGEGESGEDSDSDERDLRTRNRVEPTKRIGSCGRLVRLSLAGLLFTSMCCSGMYFHAKTTDKETGETTRLRDSIDNLIRSPLWGELYGTLRDLYTEQSTWESFFSALSDSVDLDGESSARKTLGVSDDATMKEIKSAHRRLARELHPDKGGDPVKFMEMQEAFERLHTVMKKREDRKSRRGGGGGSGDESDLRDDESGSGSGSDAADAEREAAREERAQKREDDEKLKQAKARTAAKGRQQQTKKKKKKKKKKNKKKKRTGKKNNAGNDL